MRTTDKTVQPVKVFARKRHKHEALPPEANLWLRPNYVPSWGPMRAGAQDALKIPSKGLST